MSDLSISIVTYAPNLDALGDTLLSLGNSLLLARQTGEIGQCQLIVIDNGPGNQWAEMLTHTLDRLAERFAFLNCRLITGHGNVGYGQGHNLAITQTRTEFHLVLNPDVILDSTAIADSTRFMGQHQNVGLLSPSAEDESGGRQFLCKRYPTVLDLLLRAFSPEWGKKMFRRRLDRYEMRECYSADVAPFDVPIASGCFMLCRRTALDATGGFAMGYFMYFEDFDLSLRIGRYARVVCVPSVRVIHFGGNAAKKGWRHVLMFIKSGVYFFRRNGWKLF
jgi:GT2 family glycosyltransferase